jgi:hypothetical protein
MNDRTFRDVAPHFDRWQAEERDIEDALDDDASNEQIIRIIGQERDAVRAAYILLRAVVGNLQDENAELRADRAGLAMRLDAALDRERRAQRRLRRTDFRGWVALAWWTVTRRM